MIWIPNEVETLYEGFVPATISIPRGGKRGGGGHTSFCTKHKFSLFFPPVTSHYMCVVTEHLIMVFIPSGRQVTTLHAMREASALL
jgi:hypothetical protein